MTQEQASGEALLRAWLGLAAVIWSRDLVSGMTYNEAVVCNLLSHRMATASSAPLTATELCDTLNIRKSQMNQILTSLEQRGYVSRSRSESDRRQVHLALTPAGQEAYTASHQKASHLLTTVVERLGPEATHSLTVNLESANTIVQEVLSAQRQKGTT